MIYNLMIFIFILGYLAIALENGLKIDKAATSLITAVVLWTLLITASETILPLVENPTEFINEKLMHHLGEISGILFFLLGAMSIVELVDTHGGFDLITEKITTLKKANLLWILCFVTFFMSAALDNLTTTIIMAALLKKLIKDQKDLWLFAGMVILAANAGGAWSPIGDVTTIMLWIGGQVTGGNIISQLFLPSLACLVAPLILISFRVKGNLSPIENKHQTHQILDWEKKLVMYIGVGVLLFVPIFKSLTHLPPFMGVLLGLGILWVTTEILHGKKEYEIRNAHSIVAILKKIDTAGILFFLGILLAVASLQVAGHLNFIAEFLDTEIGNLWIINFLIGVFSSIVDNVPLVAGAIGMYDLNVYPTDHTFWELLAYCAGTGGSILIIGSAAGVAMMGILKIDFIWYLKNISLYAFVGYVAGILTFLAMHTFI